MCDNELDAGVSRGTIGDRDATVTEPFGEVVRHPVELPGPWSVGVNRLLEGLRKSSRRERVFNLTIVPADLVEVPYGTRKSIGNHGIIKEGEGHRLDFVMGTRVDLWE